MMQQEEEKGPDIVSTAVIPGLFILLLLLVKYLSLKFDINVFPGVYPRTISGLTGILTFPLVHKDMEHLFSNALPLFLLGMMILYFYRQIAFRVFIMIYLLSGAGTWLIGRESYHIGASGLVNGLVSFLFMSGILRKDTRLMALSMLVVFLYGSIVWGMIPLPLDISWEAHLSGAIAGLLCAFVFRKQGPQRKVYDWELEEEGDDEEEGNGALHFRDEEREEGHLPPDLPDEGSPEIRYIYKEKDDDHKREGV